ncbi:MAG: Rrf2 family transcriptional regulator [Prolixibacteraceae bacterium]|jgi:Rrf2 family protein|nr:Rrf2 family transcriptional regulator [Prolixibacteraceae bacterium]
MLSKKTRYAILAMKHLSSKYGKGVVLISDIAKAENLPIRFLENILLELKKNGYLGSKPGKNGGYYLIKHPKEINLAQIVRYFEGTIALLYCVSEKAYQPCEFCMDERTCKIKSVFKEIRNYTYQKLEQTKLSDLVDLDESDSIMYSI